MTELLPVGPAVAEMLPFIGFATDSASRKTLGMAAAATGWVAPEIREGGLDVAIAHVAQAVAPAFLVIDLTGSAAPLAQVDALADMCAEGTRVLAIGTRNDVNLFRGLRALGVSDYLLKPLEQDLLAQSLAAAMTDREAAPVIAPGRAARGTVVAVMGARGGVGSTAIAISLAHLAAARANTMLLDLDLQGGTVALDLEAPRAASLAAILESPERVDDTLVDGAASPHTLGFRILAAEEPLERQFVVRPESVQALLSRLAATYELVLVDLPRRLDRTVRTVLRTADRVVLVTNASLAGLRDARRLLALASGLRAGQQPLIVMNRLGAGRGEVADADFEAMLGARVDARIPEVPAIAAKAIASATALSAAATGRRPAAAMARLLDQILPVAAGGAASPANRKRRWGSLLARVRAQP
ncbi:MAG: CpaE family protein [Thermaurantiacus sp.]